MVNNMNAGEIRVTCEIDLMCPDFIKAVSERFLAWARPLGQFQQCTAAIGGDPVLPDLIDSYLPKVEGGSPSGAHHRPQQDRHR